MNSLTTLRHPRQIQRSFTCGVPKQGIGLIVGGESVNKGDFPW